MTIKKVASTAALPDRRDGLKVRVHKTSELIAVLPASVRRLQLICLPLPYPLPPNSRSACVGGAGCGLG